MMPLIRFSVQLTLTMVLLILGLNLMAIAQGVSPSPAAAIMTAASSSGGVMLWIALHGGLLAVVMSCAMLGNAILSAIRDFLCWIDGIPKGGVIPANYAGLTKVNIAAIWLGKIVDYLTANVQH